MSYEKCVIIFFALVAVVALRAMAGPPQKIIGGEYVQDSEFPYLVSLRRRGASHFCAGAIIGPQHILTAAHCIYGETVANLVVVAGSSSLSWGGTVHEIKRAVMHPEYIPKDEYSYHNDIAVITLTRPMKFNKKQEAINLSSRDSLEGQRAVVAGWGRFQAENRIPLDGLTKLNTRVEDISYCASKMNKYLYKEHLCAIQPYGHGICVGDSGGPLVVNEEVVGIASFVKACGVGYPDVYTKVFAYKSFIEKEMRP